MAQVYNKIYTPEKWEKVNPENKHIIDDFILEYKAREKSEGTIKQYYNDARIVAIYCLEHLDNKSFLELTRRDFRNFMLHAQDEWHLSAARCNRELSMIHMMLAYCEDDNEEYEDYAAVYKNVVEELKPNSDEKEEEQEIIDDDYDLIAYNKLRVDFEYIIELLQGFVEELDQSSNDFKEVDFEYKIRVLKEIVEEFASDNLKLSNLLKTVIDDIENNREKYVGQDISVIVNQMRYSAIDQEIEAFAKKWYINPDDVRYEVYNFHDGALANENNLKDNADYGAYKDHSDNPMPKFKFRTSMIADFKENLMADILPLLE